MNTQSNVKYIINSFYKYRSIVVEFLLNIFSFSLLIITQQIIALPVISRYYNNEYFGRIVLAIGISNIIMSMFGFSIGSARLLDNKKYNTRYLRVFKYSSLIVLITSFFIYNIFISGNYSDSLIYSAICVLGSARYFFLSEYRLKDEHKALLKQNIFYCTGAILSLGFLYNTRSWLIVFLGAEVFSIVYTLYSLNKTKFFKSFNDTSELKLNNTIHLIINNGSSYTLMYYDRFVIFPILGASNVSIYYSAAISSKIGGLIINPLSNYILGKLSNRKEENNLKYIKIVVLGSLLVTLMYFILSVVFTPILISILYPDNLEKIKDVFVAVSLGTAIMGGTNILKPVVMKNFGAKCYNKRYIIYGVILVISSILLCSQYGLIGVAMANIISSSILFGTLIMKLYKISS